MTDLDLLRALRAITREYAVDTFAQNGLQWGIRAGEQHAERARMYEEHVALLNAVDDRLDIPRTTGLAPDAAWDE